MVENDTGDGRPWEGSRRERRRRLGTRPTTTPSSSTPRTRMTFTWSHWEWARVIIIMAERRMTVFDNNLSFHHLLMIMSAGRGRGRGGGHPRSPTTTVTSLILFARNKTPLFGDSSKTRTSRSPGRGQIRRVSAWRTPHNGKHIN